MRVTGKQKKKRLAQEPRDRRLQRDDLEDVRR